jgi:drug/metabolite transporter (DMT)-like permease
MAVVLGLAAAVAYGLSDFVAGVLSRRLDFVLVGVTGNAAAFVAAIIALAATADAGPAVTPVLWGAASGVGSALGTVVLYRGLGRSRMGVVAPLSALGAAILPVLVGVGIGERPSPLAWAGVLLSLPAIWLVSSLDASADAADRPVADPPRPAAGSSHPVPAASAAPGAAAQQRTATGVVDGLLAGVGFALLFVALDQAGDRSGLWPVVAGQIASLVLLSGYAAVRLRGSRRPRPPARDLAVASTVGLLGAAATVLFFVSTQAGLLAIVAVLTSLYPAVTVVLATVVLRERVHARQGAGLTLAAAAVILIVVG